MSDQLALGYVFGLGMVAVFNPCGFAMLPAWIGWFLADESQPPADRQRAVPRAIAIGATLTVGFVVVFLAVGLILRLGSDVLMERLPWLSILLGAAMVVIALLLLAGREPRLRLPFTARAPRSRSYRSVLGFGVSYALVSVACTIPLFLATVTTSLTSGSIAVGLLHFIAYGLGMGVILTTLTVLLAVAQTSFVHGLRRLTGHVRRASALLLAVAGAYVAYYGWHTLQVYDGNLDPGGPASWGTAFSAWMTDRIEQVGPTRITLLAGLIVSLTILLISLQPIRALRDARSRRRTMDGAAIDEDASIRPPR